MERGTIRHGLQHVRFGIRFHRLRLRFLPDRNARDNRNNELGVCRIWGYRHSGCLALRHLRTTHIHTASIATGEGSLKARLSESRGRSRKVIQIMYTAEAKEAQKRNTKYIRSLQKQNSG
jgi:hypothetical protein